MPPRRRRDGAAVPARTSGSLLGRVRVPLRQKAPRSSRRCCLSRGGIRSGSWPGRSRTRDLQTPRTIAPATRVPGASRGGHARNSFAKRASSSLERSGPRPASCRSWLAGPRRGNASKGQRNRHRLVPARSGAKAQLACEGRRLVGCARASYPGCRSRQASPRLREARTRWHRNAWTGAWPTRAREGQCR